MRGILYFKDEKWWVKYMVTADVSSNGNPMIGDFWCKAEVDKTSDIPTSLWYDDEVEVNFTLRNSNPDKTQPMTLVAVLKKPEYPKPREWQYRVIEPDGRIISVEEYMDSEDYANRLKQLVKQDEIDEEPQPVYVGTLTKPFGINGYSKAEIGHPVFELNNKYIITIFNPKNEPHVVSFYKESLAPHIQKI